MTTFELDNASIRDRALLDYPWKETRKELFAARNNTIQEIIVKHSGLLNQSNSPLVSLKLPGITKFQQVSLRLLAEPYDGEAPLATSSLR